jgi:hypothetical protein
MNVGHTIYVRQPQIGGSTMVWQSQAGRAPVAFPANSPLIAHTETPSYYIVGRHLWCQGNLKRSSGATLNSTGNDVSLGTLPYAPAESHRFAVAAAGGRTVGAIVYGEDTATSGLVQMIDPPTYVGSVSWVDLSGINFQIGA